MEVFKGRSAGWMKKLTGRGAMRSPGAPSHRREVERQFWEQVATGMTSERAAEVVGVSAAKANIATYMTWYNTRRPHSSLKRHTPDESTRRPCRRCN
jgi:transposase InsO family protein